MVLTSTETASWGQLLLKVINIVSILLLLLIIKTVIITTLHLLIINIASINIIIIILPLIINIASIIIIIIITIMLLNRLIGLMVQASALRAKDPRFESRLRPDFSGVESYQWLKKWHSSGYPARRLALQGQCWDWSARCQYTVTGWDGQCKQQLLSQCGSP